MPSANLVLLGLEVVEASSDADCGSSETIPERPTVIPKVSSRSSSIPSPADFVGVGIAVSEVVLVSLTVVGLPSGPTTTVTGTTVTWRCSRTGESTGGFRALRRYGLPNSAAWDGWRPAADIMAARRE